MRTQLGQLMVQGLDYAYTLQGWLKGINPTMGGTLTNGTDTTEAFPVTQDVYGFSLHYYKNDYRAIGFSAQATSVLGALTTNAAPLYNGNIAAMAVNIPQLSATKLYNYHYDQLNRIVAMDMYNGLSPTAGTFTPVSDTSYKERVNYDPNGNILGYLRNGDAGNTMDSLNYKYYASSNKLSQVTDNVSATKYTTDIDNQAANNYNYDAIGNMISDAGDSIYSTSPIVWNVYGKIMSVTKNGRVIRYVYDAGGNRIMKYTNADTTVYVRDATGNVLSVYDKPAGGSLVQSEMHLYGISRLGMATQHLAADTAFNLSNGFGSITGRIFTRGEKFFELSNHLGNVLVTVSDRRIQVDANSDGTVDSYKADLVSANDYYPFGMLMPGRKYSIANTNYRFGFNGKEKVGEINSDNYDFGARILDTRLGGRWFAIDPEAKRYPGYSPYSYALNTPICATDPDGRLIIFIGGLRLWVGQGDQRGYGYSTSNSYQGIYNYDVYKYWSTDKNSFGRKADIAEGFISRIGDKNAWYTSGSSTWTSQPDYREEQGKEKAKMFNAMVQSGKIKLAKDETIKIVSHSQGDAFAEGFAEQILSYKDPEGKPMYKIEAVYFITPHQPDKFTFNLPSVRGVQYSHPRDAVASNAPWWLPNGGSKYSKIVGIKEFVGWDIMGNPGQPPAEGPNGNRGGHNVTDNDFIFDIKPGEPGYVAPRHDTPQTTDKKPDR